MGTTAGVRKIQNAAKTVKTISAERRTKRVEIRATPNDKDTIVRAAANLNMSVSDFMVASAIAVADKLN